MSKRVTDEQKPFFKQATMQKRMDASSRMKAFLEIGNTTWTAGT